MIPKFNYHILVRDVETVSLLLSLKCIMGRKG